MKTKVSLVVLAFLFVTLLSCGYAKARIIEVDPPRNGLFGNLGESIDNLGRRVSDAVHAQICASIKTKISTKAIWIAGMKTSHLSRYKAIRDKLNRVIEEAGDNGYDTSQLEYDRDTLNIKINTFERDYNSFKSKIDEAKNGACDNTNDQNRNKMREVRALMRTVREDAKDIRDFYTDEIKVDMRVLKQQRYKKENE